MGDPHLEVLLVQVAHHLLHFLRPACPLEQLLKHLEHPEGPLQLECEPHRPDVVRLGQRVAEVLVLQQLRLLLRQLFLVVGQRGVLPQVDQRVGAARDEAGLVGARGQGPDLEQVIVYSGDGVKVLVCKLSCER
jgi:hypothetical protein